MRLERKPGPLSWDSTSYQSIQPRYHWNSRLLMSDVFNSKAGFLLEWLIFRNHIRRPRRPPPLFPLTQRHRNRLTYPHPWKLRIASLALALKWLAAVTAIIGIVIGVSSDSRTLLIVSLAALGAFVVFTAISTALAAELPCRVCRHPALKAKGCRKHERASAFLGLSHPLTVAVSVLFTNRFRCFYCGEKIPLAGSRRTPTDDPSASPKTDLPTAAPRPEELPPSITEAAASEAAEVPSPTAAGEASHLPARR